MSIILAVGIFVGFGATYIEMATNKDYGYPVTLSNDFKNQYTNITQSQEVIEGITLIQYNMSKTDRYTVYGDNVVVEAGKQIISGTWGTFTFIKTFILTIFNALKIPPIVFSVIIGIILTALGAVAFKFMFNKEV